MSNEEIRGEVQDTQLIGSGGPPSSLGLGGKSGSMPNPSTLPGTPPVFPSLTNKTFLTLPVYAKDFVYDYYVNLGGDPFDPGANPTGTAILPLIGPNAPYSAVSYSQTPVATMGRQPYGSNVTLIRSFSAMLFWTSDFVNYQPVPYPVRCGDTSQATSLSLNVSGSLLQEYQFNGSGTEEMPVFISMLSTDTLTAYWRISLANDFPNIFNQSPNPVGIYARMILKGQFLPDNGQPKEIQVSL